MNMVCAAPVLNYQTEGETLTLSWENDTPADGFILHYAFPDSQGNIDYGTYGFVDLGNSYSFSHTLWPGAKLFAAVQPYGPDGKGDFSGIANITVGGSTTPDTPGDADKPVTGYTFEKSWETGNGISVPESVLYDSAGGILYVSNIEGSPSDKDGNGFISKLSTDGSVISLKWAEGLDAPKGMGITGGRLYVSDIDTLREIDIATAKVTSYPISGSVFLNDVAVDNAGYVYISDSGKENTIYRFRDGQVIRWFDDTTESRQFNGIYVSGDTLYGASLLDGTLYSISLNDKSSTVVANKTGIEFDGLVPDGLGNFIVSNWYNQVSFISASGDTSEIFMTASDNAADIEYIPSLSLLVVPTFSSNKVVAYKLTPVR